MHTRYVSDNIVAARIYQRRLYGRFDKWIDCCNSAGSARHGICTARESPACHWHLHGFISCLIVRTQKKTLRQRCVNYTCFPFNIDTSFWEHLGITQWVINRRCYFHIPYLHLWIFFLLWHRNFCCCVNYGWQVRQQVLRGIQQLGIGSAGRLLIRRGGYTPLLHCRHYSGELLFSFEQNELKYWLFKFKQIQIFNGHNWIYVLFFDTTLRKVCLFV